MDRDIEIVLQDLIKIFNNQFFFCSLTTYDIYYFNLHWKSISFLSDCRILSYKHILNSSEPLHTRKTFFYTLRSWYNILSAVIRYGANIIHQNHCQYRLYRVIK